MRVIGVSVAGKTVVANSWAGFALPRDRAGNRGFVGSRSSDTACDDDDGTDKASSRLRADSLKNYFQKKKNITTTGTLRYFWSLTLTVIIPGVLYVTKRTTIEIIVYSV